MNILTVTLAFSVLFTAVSNVPISTTDYGNLDEAEVKLLEEWLYQLQLNIKEVNLSFPDQNTELQRTPRSNLEPEAYMTVLEIIQYHGYPVKEYHIQTSDGFILTVQRIPYGKDGPGKEARKPVLVQHGLLCSSASWVSNTPDKNLPYLLADKGYDVWLGNVRGTLFGRKHTKLSPKDSEFWNYSFDEMAKYDIPAVIDTMLKETGFTEIYYIGHSMGTTMAFALLSSQPKYNKIIRTVFAMAPVIKVENMKSPMRLLAPLSSQIEFLLKLLGTHELMANGNLIKLLASTICNSPIKLLCTNILFITCGYDPDQLNSTRLPIYLHHTPAATSTQTLIHFGQMVNSGEFKRRDFGFNDNKKRYGQTTPPKYNLKQVTTKIALFWGENDLLADPKDISWAASNLDNVVLKYRVPFDKFSHLDFLWAIDINRLLHEKLLKTMAKLWK